MRNEDQTSLRVTGSSEVPSSPDKLDPEFQSYCLIRRTTNESSPVSPKYGLFKDTLHGKPQNTKESRKSKSTLEIESSRRSSLSPSTKFRNVAEWSEKSEASTTMHSFESSRHPADPPRPPKDGYEWVWFPEGYWAEREIRDLPPKTSPVRPRWWNRTPERKSKSSNRTRKSSKSPPSHDMPPIPQIKIGSLTPEAQEPAKGRRSRSISRDMTPSNPFGFSFIKRQSSTQADPASEQLGLYCRAKKQIRTRLLANNQKRVPIAPSIANVPGNPSWGSHTTTVLEGASTYLDRVQRDRLAREKVLCAAPVTPRTPASPGGRSRRAFGLAPWHRRHSQESILSVSSSVHKLLIGKTPAATPSLERRYAGHDGRTYPTVDISSPDPKEPTFLPSEARRIHTPPLSAGTNSLQARGFFFDLGNPTDEGGGGNAQSSTQSPMSSAGSGGDAARSRNPDRQLPEWWDADIKHADTGNKSSHPNERLAVSQPTYGNSFVFEVPDHFPSSPLCPKNTLHKSAGTGICPYHGRRRSLGQKFGRGTVEC